MCTKTLLLITAGCVGGLLIGLSEAALGHPIWPVCIGMTIVMIALHQLAVRWIFRPLDRLIHQLVEIDSQQQLQMDDLVTALDVKSRDEVGQIARLVHAITINAARDQSEIRQLRRTLDHRVRKATATATKKLHHMTMRDSMTQLGNRRFLEENLEMLASSALMSKSDLICVMIDIDNFKQVNDTHGHGMGDDLLKFLAKLLRATSRGEDCAIRLGGDEFVVLMPACPLARAYEFAKQVRSLFTQHLRTTLRSQPDCHLSIGISSLQADQLNTGQELLDQADKYLYAAKNEGKDCIVATRYPDDPTN